MTIRRAIDKLDYEQLLEIFLRVIKTGDTYVFDPDTSADDFRKHWLASYMDTFVATDDTGTIYGTYILKANQLDLGSHIANASYMVHPDHQGKGVGRVLCNHSIEHAKNCGYRGIQFNIVVSTNTAAVALWQKCGFSIIGTTPGGFRHPQLGYVDTHIMFRSLIG